LTWLNFPAPRNPERELIVIIQVLITVKTTALLCLLLAFTTLVSAQQRPDMKEVQANMAMAQHMLDSIQKSIPKQLANDTFLSPQARALGTSNMPKMPDLNKLSKDMDANMGNAQKHLASAKASRDAGLPKKTGSSFSAVPNTDRAGVIAIATSMLPTAIIALRGYDPMLQQALDTMLVKDTTFTPQARGMMEFLAGHPKCMAEYLVCKGVLQNPDNPWAINDLGIMLRGEHRNKEAAQCFRYAYSFNDTFLIIKCNLAWAVAYYGDFITAKTYFHEILNLLPNYCSAWEGLGMIAYQEGDLAGLFQALSKQIKSIGGTGDGPSQSFTSFCGGVIEQQKMDQMNTGGDHAASMSNNTFDANTGEEEGNQDEPPTADVEYPTYPQSLGGMFPANIDQIEEVVKLQPKFQAIIKDKLQQSQARVSAANSILPPISPAPYLDDQGMSITPASSQKYFSLFRQVVSLYEDRVSEVYKGYYDDQQKLINGIMSSKLSFLDEYNVGMKRCGGYDKEADRKECERQLLCTLKPKARGMLGNNLGAFSELWTRYFMRLKDQTDWFITASTPYIKRVHNVQWNDYMNAIRSNEVRMALLGAYQRWFVSNIIYDPMLVGVSKADVNCTTPIREITSSGPDPKDVKLKKLKTAPDYCDPKEGTSFDHGPIVFESNCQHTKFGFYPISKEFSAEEKAGPATLSGTVTVKLGMAYEHVISQRHKEDDYTTLNGEVVIGGEGKLAVDGALNEGPVHLAGHGEVKAEANATLYAGWRFGSDGTYEGRQKGIDLTGGISASGNVKGSVDGIGEQRFDQSISRTAEYHGEIFAGVGSEYKVTKDAFSTH